ncbi:hypothetical protein KCU72_g18499, partial [Aureobasidium melanogenum]
EALQIKWVWRAEKWVGHGMATQNVWSRSARRKRKRVEMEQENDRDAKVQSKALKTEDPAEVLLRFSIDVREGDMEVHWLQGKDNILFESFCGMLKRSMKPKS